MDHKQCRLAVKLTKAADRLDKRQMKLDQLEVDPGCVSCVVRPWRRLKLYVAKNKYDRAFRKLVEKSDTVTECPA